MTPQEDPYVRVYYRIVNDDRFESIYHDARHLGTWLQLLLVADAMYPADAPIPAYISRGSFRALLAAGIVEQRPHQHYRLHGLASERDKRSVSARNAAAVRWQSGRNADPMPLRDETRRDEKLRDETSHSVAGARARGSDGLTPLREAMAAAGLKPEVVA